MNELSCKQLIEFLDEYVAGDQPREVRQAFEAHLDACPPCKRYMESYRKTIDLCRGAMCDEARPGCDEVPDEIVRAVMEARKKRKKHGESA